MNSLQTKNLPAVSVVIPTYNREGVLIETVKQFLALSLPAREILVIDQTEVHEEQTRISLAQWHERGRIQWIRLDAPSITVAMNTGLKRASGDIVLFVDDDVEFTSELVLEHALSYLDPAVHGVAGQVVQSWERELSPDQGSYLGGAESNPDAFMFNSSVRMPVRRFIGCNASFCRRAMLAVGGFDENFVQVAYRFEAEFAERLVSRGYNMVFNPEASLNHLKVKEGGTRSHGDHLRTHKPAHAVGRYYYLLVTKNAPNRWLQFFSSPLRSAMTRFHLSHPWWIPVTVIAEMSGLVWAIWLRVQGPKYLEP